MSWLARSLLAPSYRCFCRRAATSPIGPIAHATREPRLSSSSDALFGSAAASSAAASPAAAAAVGGQRLHFAVVRSQNGNLPVYTDLRNGRTNKRTILRKYTGDANALRAALREELKEQTGKDMEVFMYHGRMEVRGHHQDVLRNWLTRLGF